MLKGVKNAFIRLIQVEKGLMVTGFIGFVMAAVCGIYVLRYGAVVPPEGDVGSAFSFNAAIGIFILSIAVLFSVSRFSPSSKRIFRRWIIPTTLLSYLIETVQHVRGINPRFTEVGSHVDQMIGIFFALLCLIFIIMTAWLGISFFKGKQVVADSLVTGIRYAFLSTMLAFISGIVMIVLQSRFVGMEGNFIILHGLGFHALQTMPLLGWLGSFRSKPQASRLVHWGGFTWLVSMISIGLGTMQGISMFSISWLSVIAAVALLISLVIMLNAFIHFYKHFYKEKQRPFG